MTKLAIIDIGSQPLKNILNNTIQPDFTCKTTDCRMAKFRYSVMYYDHTLSRIGIMPLRFIN
jgi:hypothetical protein